MSIPVSTEQVCRHFGVCGGCAYQDMADETYHALKRDIVVRALASHGLADVTVDEIVAVGPHTRRRAAFKVAKRDGVALLGFHAASSHAIVDMQECRLLTPALWALVPQLRAMMTALLDDGERAELFVTDTADGADVAVKWLRKRNPALVAEIANRLRHSNIARVTANGEVLVELGEPSVSFGNARVRFPSGGFLQPTAEGEAALQAFVLEAAKGCKAVADLFAGCGTFSLMLARAARVHAVEFDRPSLDSLAAAARATQGLKPVTTELRDLFKRPLTVPELSRFDGVVLDPPRAGAPVQARELARSKVRRIVYVSCNPASFARDARILTLEGFRLGSVKPVDQFLWSSHIEVAATFRRD